MTAKILHLENKKCASCGNVKSADDFTKRSRGGVNRQSMCKDCHNAYCRDRYHKVHAKRRVFARLKKKYNLEAHEYDRMYKAQKGMCKICGEHQSNLKTKLHVDHCHVTKKVRGLLCFNCNRGLGSFRDNVEWLAQAISYLEDSRAR